MRVAQYPKQFTISISEETYSKIQKHSDERKVSMADVIREKLDESPVATVVVNEEVQVPIPDKYFQSIKMYSERNGQAISSVFSEIICLGLDPFSGGFEKGSVEEKYEYYIDQMKKEKGADL